MTRDSRPPRRETTKRRRLHAVAGVCMMLCAGCGKRNAYVPPPPPEVVVGTPVQRTITLYHEFPGTTQASETLSIVPRVSGYLDSLHFADGTFVKKNQPLFVIDPRPYQDAYDVALAQVHVNEAGYKDAQANNARAKKVAETPGAISKQELDLNQAQEEQAKANLELARANLANANLNLGFTHISAPISGKIGRRLVDVGNLVTANATLLTTINQYEPMYAYFNASEADFLAYLKRQRKGDAAAKPDAVKPDAVKPDAVKPDAAKPDAAKPDAAKPDAAKPDAAKPEASDNSSQQDPNDASAQHTPVEMGLSNESGYPHQGTIDFADNRVDPNTGTISIRGVFSNPRPYLLAPGLFVRIRVPIGSQTGALLVPERALGTDQQGQFLLIVRPDHVVEHRAVEVGSTEDDKLVAIDRGLKAGEQFVVEGLQFARPNSKVTPVTPKPNE